MSVPPHLFWVWSFGKGKTLLVTQQCEVASIVGLLLVQAESQDKSHYLYDILPATM